MRNKIILFDVRRLFENLMICYREIETAEDCGVDERLSASLKRGKTKSVKICHEI